MIYRISDTDVNRQALEDVPSISFFTLVRFCTQLLKFFCYLDPFNYVKTMLHFQFRFASSKDKFFIYVALLFSAIGGSTTPINTLLFASLLQSMVDYGISLVIGVPGEDAFTQAVTDFAIYNCVVGVIIVILIYAATSMMSIAAYRQVLIEPSR